MAAMTKLSVAKAADVFEEAKREIARFTALLKVAEPVLKKWFDEHPHERSYEGRIGLKPGKQARLDTEKLAEFLGVRLPEFQKTTTFESLTVLK